MVTPSMDVLDWLRKQLKEADADLLREMLSTLVQTLMGAEADALCGAAYGERSRERSNARNGYRVRDWDTRVGSIDLAITKLRQGSYSIVRPTPTSGWMRSCSVAGKRAGS